MNNNFNLPTTLHLKSFELEHGSVLNDVQIRYSLNGDPHLPVVVLMGGISADRKVCQDEKETSKGWWDGVINNQSYLNSNHFRLLSFDYLVCADELNPPAVTTLDQARILSQIQNDLKLPQFHAVIGASYGGMIALSFAAAFPSACQSVICIAAADCSTVKSQALRQIQRDIIRLGQDSCNNLQQQKKFLSLSRSLAMIGYRGEIEWEQRFKTGDVSSHASLQAVNSYLSHHGDKFAAYFSISKYCQLSLSIDLHHVDVSQIIAKTSLIAINTDQMVPADNIQNMALKFNSQCDFHMIDSIYGHDAFLIETEQLNKIFKPFLSEHYHDHSQRNNRCASGY